MRQVDDSLHIKARRSGVGISSTNVNRVHITLISIKK